MNIGQYLYIAVMIVLIVSAVLVSKGASGWRDGRWVMVTFFVLLSAAVAFLYGGKVFPA